METLTFEEPCKIAMDSELAATQTALLHAENKNLSLNAVGTRKKAKEQNYANRGTSKGEEVCSRCGKRHSSSDCWFKNYKCRKCSGVGHNFAESSDDDRELCVLLQ